MLGTCTCDVDEFGCHEDGEGKEVEAFEAEAEVFLVSCKSAEASGPGETSLDDPAFGQ
jgi:hypothetical protein